MSEPKQFRVGILGFCSGKYDENAARRFLVDSFESLSHELNGYNGEVVLVYYPSEKGVPKMACDEALQRGWRTHPFIPVPKLERDELWTSRIKSFLDGLDYLVRVDSKNGPTGSVDMWVNAFARGDTRLGIKKKLPGRVKRFEWDGHISIPGPISFDSISRLSSLVDTGYGYLRRLVGRR